MQDIRHNRGVQTIVITSLMPRELKIEITDACNLQCAFCYHGKQALGKSLFMAEEQVLRWIDWATDNDIPGVRLTGGEPTLHPQIEMFCCYARLRGRYVILNTNGMAEDELYRKVFRIVNDVRISLPTLNAEHMDSLTGGTNVLARKKNIIGMALDTGVSRVHLLTTLLPELHGTLENFILFTETSPRLFWMPLRYESTPVLPRPWTSADVQTFAEEIADLMDRYPREAQGIFLATPFCSVQPTRLGARVFHGRTEDCGPFVALNVNAQGQIQACFDVGKMGGVRSLGEIENCSEIRACVSEEVLPFECRSCAHLPRCAGGCRKPYGLVQHNGQWVDYLAGFL